MGAYVSMKDICKSFGSVKANNNVSLDVKQGEILALLGENGSGKSTIMNMLSGIYAPDSGTISIDGKPVRFSSPRDAIDHGVGMVHQHFKLVDVLTVKENIVAGSKNGFFVKGKQLTDKINDVANKYGLSIKPDEKIYNLSVSEKQTVEIVKMLYRGANVLILDEPTAVLTPQETGALFDILRNMKKQGCAIIIITHKLNEVMDISDRVSILRKGEYIGTVNTSETNSQELIEMMVGCETKLEITRTECKRSAVPTLEIKNLQAKGAHNINALNSVSFDVFGGEILGIAGIAGSGQKELCEIVAGLYKSSGGSVKFKGQELVGMSPIDISKLGVAMSFVPEDRLGMGLVAGMDIVDNVMLRTYQSHKGMFIDRKVGKKQAEEIVEKYDVATPDVNHIVKKLSGGNIQKILLGREVDLDPSLLITAYPVRGLDIGASYNVYDILNEQKAKGVAVLFIGEDLDVLMQLCDRLMVIHDGEIMGIVDPVQASKEDIGLMMLGKKGGKQS